MIEGTWVTTQCTGADVYKRTSGKLQTKQLQDTMLLCRPFRGFSTVCLVDSAATWCCLLLMRRCVVAWCCDHNDGLRTIVNIIKYWSIVSRLEWKATAIYSKCKVWETLVPHKVSAICDFTVVYMCTSRTARANIRQVTVQCQQFAQLTAENSLVLFQSEKKGKKQNSSRLSTYKAQQIKSKFSSPAVQNCAYMCSTVLIRAEISPTAKNIVYIECTAHCPHRNCFFI